VTALLDVDRVAGPRISYPPGAELLTHAEIAETITAEIGSPVEFRPKSQAHWQRGLEELATSQGGVVNMAMAQHISAVGALLAQRAGAAIMPDSSRLAEVTGRKPQSFAEFVREHRSAFIRT